MAEVITKFKLETTQYDSKLRDAARALSDFSRQASLAGNEFDKFASKGVEQARAFGSISTNATNARDKVKELVDAYNSAAKAYNALNDEQKKGEFGQAWAESMQHLKTRIQEAKAEMNSTPGVLDQLASRFTLNVDVVKLFNLGLQGAKKALEVAKDAFFANEQNLDEWGVIVQSSESLYKGFLNSLNTGSVDGFIARMDDIVTAARAAYNAMDELGTFNAFNQINTSRTRTELMESIAQYREGSATKEQVKAAADAYKSELRTRADMEQKAYETAVADIAAQRGIDADALKKALGGNYGDYKTLKEMPLSGTGSRSFTTGLGYTVTQQVAAPANEMEKLGQALRALNDTELQSLQALGAQAYNTAYQVAQVDRTVQRYASGTIKQGGTSRGATTNKITPTERIAPLIAPDMSDRGLEWQSTDLLEKVKEINANPVNIAPPEALAPLQQMEAYVDNIREKMKQAGSPEEYASLSQALEGMQQNIDEFTGKKNPGEQMAEGFSKAAHSIGMIGSALSSLEDPAAKVAGIIAEAIANVALTFSQSLKGTVTPWDWIAGAISGTATMVSTIAAIKSATAGSYAIGGTIPGSSYSGDNQIAMVNAGETILTRAQSNNLASQLGSRETEGQARPYVTGEAIYLGLNNYLKATGRGSLITSRG